jgi:hypothetical protein
METVMWFVIMAAAVPILVGLMGLKMRLRSPDADDAPPFIGL